MNARPASKLDHALAGPTEWYLVPFLVVISFKSLPTHCLIPLRRRSKAPFQDERAAVSVSRHDPALWEGGVLHSTVLTGD